MSGKVRRWWTMLMTRGMFGCARRLGLKYAVILPADPLGRLTAIVMATSREEYAALYDTFGVLRP